MLRNGPFDEILCFHVRQEFVDINVRQLTVAFLFKYLN